ncbi:MAG TPA: hypothetical protein VNQ32_08745 [Steroidobacteraceae bacterium]|nr:hypothetical protein [Steroidobacteraceae bacterium]
MNPVLHIALTCFRLLPLQRLLNLAGLLLFAAAGAVTIWGDSIGNARTVFTLCTFGVTLILLVPGFGGGMAMRLASRPTIAHLRPHGRLRILFGSTLAMTLLALIACIPSVAAHAYMALHRLGDASRFGEPLELLGFFWPVAAVAWIILFATSRTMWLAVTFPLIPLSAMQLPFLLQRYPAFTPYHLLGLGALAWTAFGLWYLGAARMQPPQHRRLANPGAAMQYQWLMGNKDEATPDSPAKAMACYLLGTGSHRVFVVTGGWTALIFLAVSFVTSKGRLGQGDLLLFMLPFLSINTAVMGFNVARRARLLWLRNGMDRKGLFLLAEKLGLRASLTTWGIVAGSAAACMIAWAPHNAPMVLLFIASQALFAVCLFYVGMALVRNWGTSDVVLGLGALGLMLAQMIFAHPMNPATEQLPLVVLGASAILMLPLRWYTLRRWTGLDWRLIQPPRLTLRRS